MSDKNSNAPSPTATAGGDAGLRDSLFVSNDMFAAAQHASATYLRAVNPGDEDGALWAALEAAMQVCSDAVDASWQRGSGEDGGVSPTPAQAFPIGPFEAWFLLRGYEVAVKKPIDFDETCLYGNIESYGNRLILKE